MRYGWMAAALMAAGLGGAIPAQAAPADPFGQCMASHTSDADRVALIRWVFAGVARSSAVQDLARVSDAQRADAMRGAAKVVERLVTRDCRSEAVAAMRRDPSNLQRSFGAIGQRAMLDMMKDPAVVSTFAGILQYLDMGAVTALMLEGGLANGAH